MQDTLCMTADLNHLTICVTICLFFSDTVYLHFKSTKEKFVVTTNTGNTNCLRDTFYGKISRKVMGITN